jgi:predicted nucleotidyltransferase component of viral defense system
MLQTGTITPDTLELLKKLQAMPELVDTRLVGGTALSFHLGHRLSIDLDLFGKFEQEILTETLRAEGFNKFDVVFENKVIKHYLINQVKVDVVKYDRYPWLENMIEENQIRVAGLKDIAAMKIAAITNRGSKKDFIDFFFLLKIFSLKEIIDFYMTKYTDATAFLAFRSLVYFNDADKDDMPRMLIPTNWEDVKKRIIAEVKKL